MFKFWIGRTYAPEGGAGEGGTSTGGDSSAHPITAPWAAGAGATGAWQIGEGAAAKPWWDAIPEPEARAHVAAKQYANPAELALANYNLTKMQRGADDILALPGKDAKPEQWDAVWKKLGRPDKPDAYDLKFGEGVKTDDSMVKFGKDLFYEMGLSNERAQKAAEKWNGFIGEHTSGIIKEMQDTNKAELDALSSKWGADLEKNKAAGQRAVQALGISNAFIERIEGAIGSAPVVELLAMIGRKSDEGAFKGGGSGDANDPANMTAQQAQAKIDALMGDAEFQKKYHDKNHPSHADAVRQMERLFVRT